MKQTIINITQTKGNKDGSTNKRRALEVGSASLHPWGHKNKELRHSLSKNDEETKETSMNITKNIYQTHIIQRSNIMKSSLSKTFVGRSVYALLTLALIATMAMGQNLIIGTGSTYGGAGTYVIKGNITNAGVVAATPIGGTVTMSSSTQLQTIGTATNGAINFGTLNISTTFGAKSTTAAVSTGVSASLAIAAASVYSIGANSLTIDALSSIGAGGSLATAALSTVIFDGGGAQTVLGGFTYNGALTLSGAGAKTMNSAGLTTVSQAFSHSGAGALTISSGGLSLTTTGAFATVNNNGGNLTGGSGAATFSGLLTQGGGNLISGSGGLVLNLGLTNTSGGITVGAGQSMAVSGAQFAYTAGALSFDPTSTVTYGGSAINIVPSTYGNLTLNTDAKIFPAGTTNVATLLTASSNMTINGTLAMSTAAANANIAGDFTDNGTFTAASGIGVVTFNGVAQAIAGTATPTFRNLTLAGTGAKTASTSINISNQLAVNQPLAMSGATVLTMKNGALTPSFTGQTEITGSMAWEAYLAATPYTYHNTATIVTFAGADAARTFTLKSAPGTYPVGNSVGHTVNRSLTASYAGWATGTLAMQLGYLKSEGQDLLVTETKLKDFQNGGIGSANKVPGLPSGRVTSGVGTFGSVTYSGLTNAQLLPAVNNALAMDDRFNMFNSIASTAWGLTTTWDAGAVPGAFDDVVIIGTHSVSIPDAYAASALSVTIDATNTNTLTVGAGASGTLAVGTGGLINNNTAGGLAVSAGGAVTITGADLTNTGKITNAGTITVGP
jgi:fibronectin-binding autotransporter adhesin